MRAASSLLRPGTVVFGAIATAAFLVGPVGCGGDEPAATSETEAAQGGSAGKSQGGAAGKGQSGSSGKASGGAAGNGQGGVGGGEPAGSAGNGTAGTGGSATTGGAGGAGGQAGADGGSGAGPGGAGGALAGGAGGSTAGGKAGSPGTAGQAGSGQAGNPGSAGKAGASSTAKHEVEMTFVTANIGRDYKTKPSAVAAFDKVGDFIDGRTGPRFIGWQEIGETDPCGACEYDALTARFKAAANWDNRRPAGKRPDGKSETVKVPVSSKEAEGQAPAVRAVYASAGWENVSPTRFVTVIYYPERNLSFLNTHFISQAWSCGTQEDKRRDHWKAAWAVLKGEVAEEHGKGRNVVVTGDLNRARAEGKCNPSWEPASLHPDARVVGGTGIDYVFAVPAKGHKFVESKDGFIDLTIDSHNAHWVSGRFLDK